MPPDEATNDSTIDNRGIYMSTYHLSTADLPSRELEIKRLAARQPLAWLSRGWGDLRAAPGVSLGYGLAVTLLAWLFVWLTFAVDRFYLVPFLFGGFLIIAPLLSVGLMAIAKRHEGRAGPEGDSVPRMLAPNRSGIALMGVFLLLVFINWIMLSNLLFGGLFHEVLPTYEQVRPLPMMFAQSVPFLAAFGGIALVLALVLFRITALSLPLLVDQPIDAFNASFASWRAVGENWPAMGVWALLIGALCGIGFATYFAGLVVIIPWLGYASWHAYRDTLVQHPG